MGITGASGRLGRLVAAAIRQQAPAAPLRLLTRNPAALGIFVDSATESAACDFDQADGLAQSFAGIATLLLISTNADPEHRARQHGRAIAAAVNAGVSRIVYTSLIGASPDSPVALARSHAQTEAALQDSAVSYTILRSAHYAQSLNGFIIASLGANCLIMPAADAKVTYIPRQNTAAAAAGAMLGTGHDNRIYDITGSHALSGQDVATLIGAVRGTMPKLVDADAWDYLQATMVPFGAPKFVIRAAEEIWAAAALGDYAHVTDHADQLAAVPLLGLPDYVRRIARAGMPA